MSRPAVRSRRKTLLHTCCAVCFEAASQALLDEQLDFEAYFYNPNIHPYREFRKRLRAAEVAAEIRKIPIAVEKSYGLQTYLDEILPAGRGRCRACYRKRLSATADEARRLGFDCFTTTLLVSTHQDHEAVKAEGEAAAEVHGVEFLYRDWRERAQAGLESARRKSLYRQQYCGCIWSEYERFRGQSSPPGE